jgi:hypothetical protein
MIFFPIRDDNAIVVIIDHSLYKNDVMYAITCLDTSFTPYSLMLKFSLCENIVREKTLFHD